MKHTCPLIVIEGGDASGKTLQIKLLAKKLRQQGKKVKIFDFPKYDSFYGKIIKAYLNGDFGQATKINPFLASILYVMNRFEVAPQILRAQKKYDVILMNRYYSANYIHQGAKITGKNAKKRRIELFWLLESLELDFLKIPKANLIIYLHVPALISQKLMNKEGRLKDQHEKDIVYAKRVEKIALWLCKIQKNNWKLIECSPDGKNILSPSEIHKKIYEKISPLV